MYTAFFFFGGIADLFLSTMLWFIFDEDKEIQMQIDDDRVYPVLDVIDIKNSLNDKSCGDPERGESIIDGERASTIAPIRYSRISKRMVE